MDAPEARGLLERMAGTKKRPDDTERDELRLIDRWDHVLIGVEVYTLSEHSEIPAQRFLMS